MLRCSDQIWLRLEPYVLALRGIRVHPTSVLGNVEFDGPAIVEAHCRLMGSPRLKVGRNAHFGPHVHCQGDIVLGDDVWVGPRVTIWGRDHGIEAGTPICQQPHRTEPIRVGCDVEIGAGSILLRGITIGDGARLRSGSVCTQDVASGAVVSGSPAQPSSDEREPDSRDDI